MSSRCKKVLKIGRFSRSSGLATLSHRENPRRNPEPAPVIGRTGTSFLRKKHRRGRIHDGIVGWGAGLVPAPGRPRIGTRIDLADANFSIETLPGSLWARRSADSRV